MYVDGSDSIFCNEYRSWHRISERVGTSNCVAISDSKESCEIFKQMGYISLDIDSITDDVLKKHNVIIISRSDNLLLSKFNEIYDVTEYIFLDKLAWYDNEILTEQSCIEGNYFPRNYEELFRILDAFQMENSYE